MSRKILLGVALLSLSYAAAQDLSGCYREYYKDVSSYDVCYRFFQDGTFQYEESDDIGSYIGMGKYALYPDSIVFNYTYIPPWIKEKQLLSVESSDSLSSLTLVNPWNKMPMTFFNYRVYRGDELLSEGVSDAQGRASLLLKAGERVKIWNISFMKHSIVSQHFLWEIEVDSVPRDYVLFSAAFSYRPASIEPHRVVLPIRRSWNNRSFKLKLSNGWKTYINCSL